MTTDDEDHDDDPQGLAHLLPFYVSGALGPEDRVRVEAALEGDPALRREVEEIRAFSAMVRAGGPALAREPPDAELRLRRLMARLEATSAASRPCGRASPRRLSWKLAFVASAAVIVAQAAVISWQAAAPRGDYQGLAGPAPPPAGADLLVTFAADARWAEVQALLSRRNLEIVGGPASGGVEVAVPPGASLETELQALRASKVVDFAGIAG